MAVVRMQQRGALISSESLELTWTELRKKKHGDGITKLHPEVCNFYLWDDENEWQAYNFDTGAPESVVSELVTRKCTRFFLGKQANRKINKSCNWTVRKQPRGTGEKGRAEDKTLKSSNDHEW